MRFAKCTASVLFGVMLLWAQAAASAEPAIEALAQAGEPARLDMLSAIKPWSGGQLHQGEKRAPQTQGSDRLVPEAGRIHIGTHEFYRDPDGVRKIDKVLSSYIQGICSDFTSEHQTSCEASGNTWYDCPEDFPHADSKIRAAKVHIPICYTRRQFAEAGKGPAKSWCVPSHLISAGPKIADWIDQGLGVVCDTRERGRVDKETDKAAKWKAKAKEYKMELRAGAADANLEARLREEKRKDKEWHHLANAYKRQVEDDRDSAKVAVDQLQDALADMNQGSGSSTSSKKNSKPLGSNVQGPRCDSPWQHESRTSESACRYVKRQCRQRGGMFNYLTLPYCSLPAIPYFAVVILLAWVAFLFIWMANAANAILCPSLLVIADLTKMGEEVAGVTLLALGNGAGDVASVIAATVASKQGSQMAVGEVLGSSLFVSGAILGLVTLSASVPAVTPDLIRDLCFLLGAVLWVLWVLHDSYISMLEALGFVALYLAYLAFVLNGHFAQLARGKGAGPDGIRKVPARFAMPLQTVPEERSTMSDRDQPPKAEEQSLVDYLLPFSELPNLSRNRTALLIQLFLAPAVWTWAVLVHGLASLSPASLHLSIASALVLGGLLAFAASNTSSPGVLPHYHRYISVLGFVTSMAWIYILAVEAVHALQVGDLVANVAVAKAGMQAMCVSACIGSPIFIILFGGGVASLLGNVLVASPYPLELNLEIFVAGIFLFFTVVATLVYLVLNHMQAGRNLGLMLVLIYGAFICSVVGMEMVGGTSFVQKKIAVPGRT